MCVGVMPMLLNAVTMTAALTVLTDADAGTRKTGAVTRTVEEGMSMLIALSMIGAVLVAVLVTVMVLTVTLTRTTLRRLTLAAGREATMTTRRPPAKEAELGDMMMMVAMLIRVMEAMALRWLELMIMSVAARGITSTSISPAPLAPRDMTSRNGKGTPPGGRSDEKRRCGDVTWGRG